MSCTRYVRSLFFHVLFVVLMVFGLSATTNAAVPRTITHQGYLTGQNLVPVSGPVDMTFALYSVELEGTAVWSETQTVQVNNGVYAAALGAIEPLTTAMMDGALWLGTTIGDDAEMSPRQKLTSVGFALKAASVEDGSVGDAQIVGPISADKLPDLAALQAAVAALQGDVSTLNTMSSPIALPGSGGSIPTRATYTLSGTGSDVDNRSLTYSWSVISKPASSLSTLSNDNTNAPSFTPDIDGDYTLQLVVDNGYFNSDPAFVNYNASNYAPVAVPGSDKVVRTESLVSLDGSGSSDVNVDPLNYEWSFISIPVGSTAAIANPSYIASTFIPDLDGNYVIRLTVTDPFGGSSSATKSINAVTLRFLDNGDGTLSDSSSGLVWLRDLDSGCVRSHGCDTSDYVNDIYDGRCGLTDGSASGDWRLPTLAEMQELMDDRFSPQLSNSLGTDVWTNGDPWYDWPHDRFYVSDISPNTGCSTAISIYDGTIEQDTTSWGSFMAVKK